MSVEITAMTAHLPPEQQQAIRGAYRRLAKHDTTAFLLCFFAGTLGVHRIYLGEWVNGLLHEVLVLAAIIVLVGGNLLQAPAWLIVALLLLLLFLALSWELVDLFIIDSEVDEYNRALAQRLVDTLGATGVPSTRTMPPPPYITPTSAPRASSMGDVAATPDLAQTAGNGRTAPSAHDGPPAAQLAAESAAPLWPGALGVAAAAAAEAVTWPPRTTAPSTSSAPEPLTLHAAPDPSDFHPDADAGFLADRALDIPAQITLPHDDASATTTSVADVIAEASPGAATSGDESLLLLVADDVPVAPAPARPQAGQERTIRPPAGDPSATLPGWAPTWLRAAPMEAGTEAPARAGVPLPREDYIPPTVARTEPLPAAGTIMPVASLPLHAEPQPPTTPLWSATPARETPAPDTLAEPAILTALLPADAVPAADIAAETTATWPAPTRDVTTGDSAIIPPAAPAEHAPADLAPQPPAAPTAAPPAMPSSPLMKRVHVLRRLVVDGQVVQEREVEEIVPAETDTAATAAALGETLGHASPEQVAQLAHLPPDAAVDIQQKTAIEPAPESGRLPPKPPVQGAR